MINRELIRLKVVQLIYAYYQNEGKTIEVAEKELMFSLNKAYDLYEYLLTILIDLKNVAEKKEEVSRARNQRLGTNLQGLSVDGRFAANQFLVQLAANKVLLDYRTSQKKDWVEEEAFIKKLYTQFLESEIFQFYLTKEDFSYEADREVIRKLYKTCICNNEDFDNLIEDHSLYWNDDKEIVDSFVLKTIKRFTEESTEDQPLLPVFASDEDRKFAVELFRTTIERSGETRQLIKENCRNWEFNRLAFMDVIISQIALTEILTFPTIPLSVSFNEYLDIAKVYSTPRSASYINGMLDHVVKKLKAENKLLK
ncbi:MAG: transcription antitermination protein NusB [Bacteroidales bacterium]|nr:transcription antitermination protein NusB [Bacteroidales bacterium]